MTTSVQAGHPPEPGGTGASFGVVLQAVDPTDAFREMVTEIERRGFGHLWLTDSSLHARDCYSYLTLAAARSTRLVLGTAVTNPVTRHPGGRPAAARDHASSAMYSGPAVAARCSAAGRRT